MAKSAALPTPVSPFRGATVVVVGASRGLGRQYARDLGRFGANVVMTGRSEEIHAAAAAIRKDGDQAIAVQCDSRDAQPFIDAALAEFGAIDGLIVNAGIVRDRSFAKLDLAEWNEVIDSHLGGSFACAKAVWGHMAARRKGAIVLTTSGAGLHGAFGQANYAAAKAGIIGLAKTLAIEGARLGIRVNAVAPMALTDMTANVFSEALKQGLPPAVVSPFVLSLLDDRSTLTGAVVECGGGWGALLRWQRAQGLVIERPCDPIDITRMQASMANFDIAFDLPASTADSLGAAMHEPRSLTTLR